ncbi:glycerophosphoryl diester phosphodiesterase [Lipingzhangella halophila]|uniref:Glycerophosphoryl diester phosphodiesterase n=1 Tax=Lipingzhangella halophila TaxID=1783352 RepID=A0A7W7RIN3_9ACTN|nr:glycerophosphodiester phosphodiesterase [Lipingzhangella halophila]MBB4932602.1 glycerophosphoryl diester phosphodiesterase [Lipingzhangella halophila]
MTLAIADRGDPIQFQENTLSAIRAAANAGADMVRVDLTLSSDGYVVLLHDDTARRAWGQAVGTGGLSLADLAALGCGDDQRVPTLVEVLAEFGPGHALQFMLEVTSTETALATDDLVLELGLAQKVGYTGSVEVLRALRARRPSAELALTWDRPELPDSEVWQAVRPRFFNVHHSLVTREMVAEVHGRGHQISAWTVNDFTEMARLIGMGVDAVITEHPAELAALAQGQRGLAAEREDHAPIAAAEPRHGRHSL